MPSELFDTPEWIWLFKFPVVHPEIKIDPSLEIVISAPISLPDEPKDFAQSYDPFIKLLLKSL